MTWSRWTAPCAVFVAALASAVPAHAEDGAAPSAEVRKLVQDEIKAYLEKKKVEDAKAGVMKATWKDGLTLSTSDKAYSVKIGGRIHLDTQFVDDDELEPISGVGDVDDQTFFRRLRLYVMGDLTKHVDYRIQVDFATPQNPVLRDAYITIKSLKDCVACWMPNVRAGHQWEPIGLETISGSNAAACVEPSLTTTFHPQRQGGLNLLDSFWNERATTQLGVFSTDFSDDADGLSVVDSEEGDGGYAITGRFTLVPWAKDTCRFLHVGASASYRTTDEVRFRARPGLSKGPYTADTGTLGSLDSDNLWIWNAELALVWRRFHASAEATLVELDETALGSPSFSAWYVQAGWFLTGETRGYNFKTGTWAITKPCCNFLDNSCCCLGAFELVARYDTLDLNDGAVQGGEMSNITVGLNWHLNANARIMLDVIFSTTEDRNAASAVIDEAEATSFLMRWDVHF
ncbi:MAG: OprO/OprP family phosphate-selective porin [Planctomycetia bacterium]